MKQLSELIKDRPCAFFFGRDEDEAVKKISDLLLGKTITLHGVAVGKIDGVSHEQETNNDWYDLHVGDEKHPIWVYDEIIEVDE